MHRVSRKIQILLTTGCHARPIEISSCTKCTAAYKQPQSLNEASSGDHEFEPRAARVQQQKKANPKRPRNLLTAKLLLKQALNEDAQKRNLKDMLCKEPQGQCHAAKPRPRARAADPVGSRTQSDASGLSVSLTASSRKITPPDTS